MGLRNPEPTKADRDMGERDHALPAVPIRARVRKAPRRLVRRRSTATGLELFDGALIIVVLWHRTAPQTEGASFARFRDRTLDLLHWPNRKVEAMSYYLYAASGYASSYFNKLYLDLHGLSEYYYANNEYRGVYYSGFADENADYGKYYHTSYYNAYSGYYHGVSVYTRGSEHTTVSETTSYAGSSYYFSRYTNDIDGDPARGYSGLYTHHQAGNGSSTTYFERTYETFGGSTPFYTATYHESVYTNAYGYSYSTSGTSHS